MNTGDKTTTITVVLPRVEREFILEAVKVSGGNISAFMREAALERASAALGREIERPGAAKERASYLETLHGYVGGRVPAGLPQPAVSFGLIRSFVAAFSDRNRAMLRAIGRGKEGTLYELAEQFGYSYSTLIDTLRRLRELGIVGDTGLDVRGKIPSLRGGRVKLVLPFGDTALDSNFFRLGLRSVNDETAAPDAARILQSMNEFRGAVTDRGYDLLRLMWADKPESLRAVAALRAETAQSTYALVRKCEAFGLVETVVRKRCKSARIVHDGIEVEIVLRS